MGKVCTKPILRLLWKMVENMLFLDSEHVEMGVVVGGGGRGGLGMLTPKFTISFEWGGGGMRSSEGEFPPPKEYP